MCSRLDLVSPQSRQHQTTVTGGCDGELSVGDAGFCIAQIHDVFRISSITACRLNCRAGARIVFLSRAMVFYSLWGKLACELVSNDSSAICVGLSRSSALLSLVVPRQPAPTAGLS